MWMVMIVAIGESLRGTEAKRGAKTSALRHRYQMTRDPEATQPHAPWPLSGQLCAELIGPLTKQG